MIAIWKREVRAYFQTVIGWLFIAATLALFGLYFYVYNMYYGTPDVSYAFSAITILFLITVPVLTMRTLAEERKNKTDQMILTAPVSVEKVVFAKFLATATVFTIAVAVMCLAPLFLSRFGTVAYSKSYLGALGFWLYGLACIAIGTFVSSLTESAVISAVVTFVLLFVGYMMGSITNLISSAGNLLTKILSCYDLTTHLDMLMSGILDVSGIVYYLTVTLLFLFLTTQVIQKRRWSMNSRKIGLGVFNSAMVAGAVALTVIVNLVVGELPGSWTSVDLTAQKMYSITEDTKKLLHELEEDVTIYVLEAEGSMDDTLATTLKRYEEESSHIKVEYKDPSVYPNFYMNYTEDTSLTRKSLIVESGKRAKVINYTNIYESSFDYSTYTSTTTGYDGEGQLTSAISYVTSEDMPVVYTLRGHGESSLTGSFEDAVEKANITLEELNLLTVDAVPEDAAALLIHGAASDLSEEDAAKIKDYVGNGGKLLVTLSYTDQSMEHLYEVLQEFGVSVADGMVMETDRSAYYQVPYYLLPVVENDSITSGVDGYVFAPYALGMTYDENAEGLSYTPLLTTTDQSYSKGDVQNMTTYEKEEGDIDGPFSVGLRAEKTLEDGTAELLVFSSAQIFDADTDAMVSGNNLSVFSSCISGYGDEESASGVVIPVKEYENTYLTVSAAAALTAAVLGIVVIPLALLASGIVIWLRRRKR